MPGKLLCVNPALQGAREASAPSPDTSLPKGTKAPEELTESAQTRQPQGRTHQEPHRAAMGSAPSPEQGEPGNHSPGCADADADADTAAAGPGPGQAQKHTRRPSRAPRLAGTFPPRGRTRQPTAGGHHGRRGSAALPYMGTAGSTCVMALARSVSAGAGRHVPAAPAARRPGNQTVNTAAGRGGRAQARQGLLGAARDGAGGGGGRGSSGVRVSHRPPEGRAALPRGAGRGGERSHGPCAARRVLGKVHPNLAPGLSATRRSPGSVREPGGAQLGLAWRWKPPRGFQVSAVVPARAAAPGAPAGGKEGPRCRGLEAGAPGTRREGEWNVSRLHLLSAPKQSWSPTPS